MPKMKTKRAAAKRFKVRSGGSIKFGHSTKRHILSHRTTKNKRHLRGMVTVAKCNELNVKRMLAPPHISVNLYTFQTFESFSDTLITISIKYYIC